MSNPTPVRHGNWHMVNGQLVDLDAAPAPAAAPADPAPDTNDDETRPSAGVPAEGEPRRRKQSTKE